MKSISLSTFSFYYWFDRPRENWIRNQLEVLDMVRGIVDCVEIHMIYRDIFKLTDSDIEEYKKKLAGFKITTLHLPTNLVDIFKEEELVEFDNKVVMLVKELGIKHCVFHADQFEKAKYKFSFPFALENPDKSIGEYDLKRMKDYDLPLAIDVDHAEEMKKGLFDEQVDLIKDNIVEVHFSVPENESYKEFPYIETPHYLAVNSGYPIPKKIPKDTIWVIEGVIPKDRMDLFKAEIELIRRY